jgi:glycosyltransferase involved in cell wall biosynthesis
MKKKKILIVSYYPFGDSISMYLWTADKIKSLQNKGFKIDLLTSPLSSGNESAYCRVFRVPSFNLTSFFREFKDGNKLIGFVFLPIILTLGIIHEVIERLILGRIGHGMWGWTLPSLIGLFSLNLINRYDTVLSLGGPTSAHLSVAISSRFFGSKHIIEFQDPIVGVDIGFNDKSAKFFVKLERFVVYSKSKVVFVTNAAAIECRERYPGQTNIFGVYSSSFIQVNKIDEIKNPEDDYNKINLHHFGTIYSTRNYDNLIEAIKKIDAIEYNVNFSLTHHGNKIDQIGLNLPGCLVFSQEDTESRENAYSKLGLNSMLILIQHKDERSKLTIPYKTWDYLNLMKPILALLNNKELKEILDKLGHYTCDVNDVDSIVSAILKYHKDRGENKIKILPNPYNINQQVLELIT